MTIRKSGNELHGLVGFMRCHKGKTGYKTIIFSSQSCEAGGKPTVNYGSFKSLAAIPKAGLVKTSDIS